MKKTSHKRLFWAAIAVVLLLGINRIVTTPTASSGDSRSPVIVSEFMAANQTTLADEDGEFSDWIEIHNRSLAPVDLFGWSLTNDPERTDKWLFPEVTLRSGEHLVVFASGKDRAGIGEDGATHLHTNFKLSADGDFLALYSPTLRRFLDGNEVSFPEQVGDRSFGLCPDGKSYCYLAEATPGEANGSVGAWTDLVAPVAFSVERGIYETPITVALTASTPDTVIRYTTDGSAPTESNGSEYTGPILIDQTTTLRATAFKPGLLAPPPMTHTYIFLDDVLSQSADQPDFPDRWGTYTISIAGHSFGDPVMPDYEMDPKIVEDPEYGPMLEESLRSLPSVSIVADVDDLDIYFKDPQMRGPESERAASFELIYPDGSKENLQVNAGLRIQGGVSRWEYMPKHSFRLFFTSDYGPSKLNEQLFPDSFVDSFDTLILRAGTNRSFSTLDQDPRETTLTHDEWGRESQIAMSGVGSHGTFAHLYLNGLYWGIYNIVERPDASFASAYYGGRKDDWYSASQGGSVSGQWDRFAALIRLAGEGSLADPGRYATMLEFIDPAQLSDYVLLHWFAGTKDWPDNNWYVGVQFPAGRNLFFTWDYELSWNGGAELVLGVDQKEGSPFPNVVKLTINALMENPDFRIAFADRVYKHLFNGGALTDENAQARWLRINDEVEKAIVSESARWGDVRLDDPVTPADWRNARDYVLSQMDGNGARFLALLRDAGYYPAIDPPAWSQHGGVFTGTLDLTMSSPVGAIYYTTDGSDPRSAITGDVSAAAVPYVEPVTLTTEATVKARVLHEGVWSALREATFREATQQPDLRITELMYNPPGGSDYEFIELKNAGAATADLSHAYIDGIDYRFPLGASLAPGEFQVLIRDFPSYREMHPTAPFHGFYTGRLSNRGETIRLLDAQGAIIAAMTYSDANGWPLSANGGGDSLVLIDPNGNPDDPASWRASSILYGSPGKDEAK